MPDTMTSLRFCPSPLPGLALLWAPLALGLLTAGCTQNTAAPPLPHQLRVDGDRAFGYTRLLVELGPRPSGTANAAKAAAWLRETCRTLGYQPSVDEWQEDTPAGTTTFRNVEATLAGRPGAPTILLASHYDTKRIASEPDFVGANDSGSSTGLLLELMRTFAAVKPWGGCSLHFAFFDGEECVRAYDQTDGLHGSRRLAQRLVTQNKVGSYRAMILLDMVGDRDLTLTLPTDSDPDLLRRFLRLAVAQGVAKHVSLFERGQILDDHTPFQNAGMPSLDLIDFAYGPGQSWWHTREDTLDKLSPRSLEIVGNLTAALVLELGAPAP